MLRHSIGGQQERIAKAIELYPASTERRKNIRAFVTKCAQDLKFKDPVLDVGAGYRSNEPEICSNQLYEYYMLDIKPDFKPDILCDAEHMKTVPSSSFGCVVCTEVLEHTPNPNLVVEEMYRVLQMNGLLILTVPFWVSIHEKPLQPDYWRFTPRGVRYMLKRFQIEIFETTGNILEPVGIFVAARKL